MIDRTSVSRRTAMAGVATLTAGAVTGVGARTATAAAPMLGASSATHHRFALGAFEVTILLDGATVRGAPDTFFGDESAADEIADLVAANFLPREAMVTGFAPVIVNTGNELVLFDTGNGVGRRPDAGKLVPSTLAAAGYSPEQVDVVVLTHFHPDHIGGLIEEGAPAFPNARYVTNAIEYDFWSAEERLSGGTERVAALTQSNVVPFAENTTFINDGEDVVGGVTALAAYGHTPGHTIYHLESEGRRLLVWGDLANHYVVGIQRPDLPFRFDADPEAAAASRKRVMDMVAADRIPFTGYHMPFPSVGYIDTSGGGYRYVAASYQFML